MRIEQACWTAEAGWAWPEASDWSPKAQLVLVFGSTEALRNLGRLEVLVQRYASAHIVGCSTSGEILGTRVRDDSISLTAVEFEHSAVRCATIAVADTGGSYGAGVKLAGDLAGEGLAHVFVLSDGLRVNGSELVRGLTDHLPSDVTATGGLSGDGGRFADTVVLCDGAAEARTIAAIGLYGSALRIGYASLGGWDSFGPERLVTRAEGNVLYELDGRSALDLYKQYLGEHADGLPATGLLFPLSIRTEAGESPVVRTILAVDEATQSMVFAGDIPQGAYARLMKANFDRLIDGAVGAARATTTAIGGHSPDLAILISCVGRKMVLRQRIEEEVEGVRKVLGERTALTGFYSYGEISPFTPNARCELHNQTMTITTISEAA